MMRFTPPAYLVPALCALLLFACSKEETPTGNADDTGGRSVTISPGSASLQAGDSLQLTATMNGTLSAVHWSLSPAVGSMSGTGLYRAPVDLSADSVQITVTATSDADPAATGKMSITVRQMPTRQPGVGSIYLIRSYQTDSSDTKTPGSEATGSLRVIGVGMVHDGMENLTAISADGDTTYYRIENSGDVWIQIGAFGYAPTTWIRLPFGGEDVSMVLADSVLAPGLHLTETFVGKYDGTATETVDGRPLLVRRASYTLIEDLTTTDGYHYVQTGSARFAPALGFFTHTDWFEDYPGFGGRSRDGGGWDLTTYVLK